MKRVAKGTITVQDGRGRTIYKRKEKSERGALGGVLSSNDLQVRVMTILRMIEDGEPGLLQTRRIVIDLDMHGPVLDLEAEGTQGFARSILSQQGGQQNG